MRLCAVVGLRYLGKHAVGRARCRLFHDGNGLVSALSLESTSVVQAFRRLVLQNRQASTVDLEQLHVLLASYSASLEISTTRPSQADAEHIVRPTVESKTLETELKRLRQALQREKQAYEKWKGVRDLDEAHENLRARNSEIFDLNQKLVANATAPRIIYEPKRYTVSAWQQTDRTRFSELRLQAEKRGSALRPRIDFTRKTAMRDLEEKVKDLEKLLQAERKREKSQQTEIRRLLENEVGLRVSLLVKGRALSARGRIGGALKEASGDAEAEAAKLCQRLKAVAGLQFETSDAAGSPLLPDLGAVRASGSTDLKRLLGEAEQALCLVPRDAWAKDLNKLMRGIVGPVNPDVPDLSRFPSISDAGKRRLAYLGLATVGDGLSFRSVVFDLDEQGPRHTAVVGGSGSGKSVAASLVVEGALLHGVPVLVFDPTRAWTGFAQGCVQQRLLEKYSAFHMKTEWARGFETRIIDPSPGDSIEVDDLSRDGVTVVSPSKLGADQEAELIAGFLEKLLDAMQAWSESRQLRALVVFEEAHQYLKHKRIQPLLELLARTARAKGLGLLVVSQVAVDLPPAIRSNCATKIQLQTNYAQDLTRAAQVFGSDKKDVVARLRQGRGLMHFPEYGSASVAFRPPLHSPSAVPQPVAAVLACGKHLAEAVARAMSVATDDATRQACGPATAATDDSPRGPSGASIEKDSVRTWRDVATELVTGARVRPTAKRVLDSITALDTPAPSLRTLQRFLADK